MEAIMICRIYIHAVQPHYMDIDWYSENFQRVAKNHGITKSSWVQTDIGYYTLEQQPFSWKLTGGKIDFLIINGATVYLELP